MVSKPPPQAKVPDCPAGRSPPRAPSPAFSPHSRPAAPGLAPALAQPDPQPEGSARTHSGRTPAPVRWPTWPTRSAPWWRRRPRLGGIPATLRAALPPPAQPEGRPRPRPAPCSRPRPAGQVGDPAGAGADPLSVRAGTERGGPAGAGPPSQAGFPAAPASPAPSRPRPRPTSSPSSFQAPQGRPPLPP